MSSPQNFASPTDVAAGPAGRPVVQGEAPSQQPLLSKHQELRAIFERGLGRQTDSRRAQEDYVHKRISDADFLAVMRRIYAAKIADHQRIADIEAPDKQASHAQLKAFVMSEWACTEDEADRRIEGMMQQKREGTMWQMREAELARGARERQAQMQIHGLLCERGQLRYQLEQSRGEINVLQCLLEQSRAQIEGLQHSLAEKDAKIAKAERDLETWHILQWQHLSGHGARKN